MNQNAVGCVDRWIGLGEQTTEDNESLEMSASFVIAQGVAWAYRLSLMSSPQHRCQQQKADRKKAKCCSGRVLDLEFDGTHNLILQKTEQAKSRSEITFCLFRIKECV